MTDPSGPEAGWWLVCATHEQNDDSRGAKRQLRFARKIDQDEAGLLKSSSAFLGELADRPYVAVVQAVDDLFHSRYQLLNQPAFRQVAKRTDLRERLSYTLYTFRRYLDRTRFELTVRYGKDSSELAAFVETTRAEYDANFTYRLAYNLRNESDHRRHVADIIASGERADSNTQQRSVRIVLRDEVIEEASRSSGWQASVAHELRGQPRPIELDQMLQYLRGAVLRIESSVLEAQHSHVDASGQAIEAAIASVSCDGEVLLVEWPVTGMNDVHQMSALSMQEQIASWLTIDLLRHSLDQDNWPTWQIPAGIALFLDSQRLEAFSWYLTATMAIDSKVELTAPGSVMVQLRAPTALIARRLVADAIFNSGPLLVPIGAPAEISVQQSESESGS